MEECYIPYIFLLLGNKTIFSYALNNVFDTANKPNRKRNQVTNLTEFYSF